MNILNKIFSYFSKQELIFTVIVTIISNYSYELVSSLINTIIIPLVYNKKQKSHFINGVKVDTSHFLRTLIKFSLLIFIISIFIVLLN